MYKKTAIKALSLVMATGSSMAQSSEPLPLHKVQFNFKPNVLWLSCEDISHHYLPIYGDSTIETPFLSQLAKDGIVFNHAHATSGVCSASRCSIITGMYATSIGGHNMRTVGDMPLPDNFQFLPEYFKDAGYYCTNNVKTDYNISWDTDIWDDNGYTAHWKHREPGQPFFAVFNGTLSHESRIFYMMWDNCFMPDTAGMKIPPYFPQNDPVIKQDIARNYSNIIMADKQAAHFYTELENSGLLDSTIVVFWSDHGGPLPRGKREIYTSGTQVPMVIRFPKKMFAGQHCNQLVSLMDLGPAMLSLCGIKPPEHFEGRAFAGKYAAPEPEFVFAARDRLGANPDTRRAVISKDFLYIRNYHPEMPVHHREIYRNQIHTMKRLTELYENNQLNDVQKIWFAQQKPFEEFYIKNQDFYNINNRIHDQDYAVKIEKMRVALNNQIITGKDLGFIPEPELIRLQQKYQASVYDIVRMNAYPVERLMKLSVLWKTAGNPVSELKSALKDKNAVIRYWGVYGLINAGEKDVFIKNEIEKLLDDESGIVRIISAYALTQMGDFETGLNQLAKEMRQGEHTKRAYAIYYISQLGSKASALLPELLKYTETESYLINATAYNAIWFVGKNTKRKYHCY